MLLRVRLSTEFPSGVNREIIFQYPLQKNEVLCHVIDKKFTTNMDQIYAVCSQIEAKVSVQYQEFMYSGNIDYQKVLLRLKRRRSFIYILYLYSSQCAIKHEASTFLQPNFPGSLVAINNQRVHIFVLSQDFGNAHNQMHVYDE